ncbi:membrane protein insertion efficiency factor YidD [PVC group bacterium (ex Bugula neritina AB1)]|nr:membrane protein insertion efficiency factor YidD [PVC group bacterium (ex Bugula neritina AB1)]
MRKGVIFLISLYRAFSDFLLPKSCRFAPSCSQYASEAFASLSFFKASALTLRRLFRCHPWSSGGLDFVPLEKKKTL